MNTSERNEVRDITERLNRIAGWARWILGGVGGLCAAVALYAITTEGRISTLEQAKETQAEKLSVVTKETSELSRQSASRGREISGMAAQLIAQNRTLNRIDSSVSDLARYLRDKERDTR